MKISIYRVSCRACGKISASIISLKKAKERHREHIKTCATIKAIEKVERFRKESEKILGLKVSLKEAAKILGCKV